MISAMGDLGEGHLACRIVRCGRTTQTIDAALIAAAQKVEHCGMTRYGPVISWAKQLGNQDEETDRQKLTQIAEAQVNRKAA